MYRKFIKRIMDFIVAILIFIITSPFFLILALIIRIDSSGPIFFSQKRVGKDDSFFNILKFRTMRTDTPNDMPTHLLQNPDAYITKVGKFLRKTSLDELPQLINIIKGEMSIVGPRPALWNQYDLIELRRASGVNSLVPGLTGLAQISGRDELEIVKKVEYDNMYYQKMSFLTDCKLVIKTVFSVLSQKGVKEGSDD